MNWMANGIETSYSTMNSPIKRTPDSLLNGGDSFDNDSSSLDVELMKFGLSAHSQELICEFHTMINQGSSPTQIRLFEEILCALVDDLQKYKLDIQRLESCYRNEKEKHEETIKNMIEEAENQLNALSDKIRQEEKKNNDRQIDNLKREYDEQISFLKENLNKFKQYEKLYNEGKKTDNSSIINELKRDVDKLTDENKNLRIELRESKSEVSILRSEIAELKSDLNDENNPPFGGMAITEIKRLKNEINALHDANKKLNDANDIIRSEYDSFKQKSLSLKEELTETPVKIPKSKRIQDFTSNIRLRKNRYDRMSSIEADDEHESGFIASANEYSDNNHNENDWSLSTINHSSGQMSKNESGFISNSFSEEVFQSQSKSTPKIEKIDDGMPPERMFKIVFAGDSAVGKTSFITKYCRGVFNEAISSTLGVDFYMKMVNLQGKKIAIQLWDTCGQERFRSIAKSYFRRADGVVLMYDCTYEKSFLSIREWIEIINEISDKRLPIILIANKIDLRDEIKQNNNNNNNATQNQTLQNKSHRRLIEYQDGARLAKEYNCLFMETSVKHSTNIDDSLIEMCSIMSSNQDIELKSDSIKLGLNTTVKKKCC